MAVKTRIEPFDTVIELTLNEYLSGPARSAVFAQFAAETINAARQANRQVMGRDPAYTVTVDGALGAPLTSVKPDGGVIIAEFEIVHDSLLWIMQQLQRHSPILYGVYVNSHELFADGNHVPNPATAPPAKEYVFLNVRPYARKIERGLSPKAPNGVYRGVAALASGKYGNSARISFSYRSAVGFASLSGWANRTKLGGRIRNQARRADWLTRQPAIIVRPY